MPDRVGQKRAATATFSTCSKCLKPEVFEALFGHFDPKRLKTLEIMSKRDMKYTSSKRFENQRLGSTFWHFGVFFQNLGFGTFYKEFYKIFYKGFIGFPGSIKF